MEIVDPFDPKNKAIKPNAASSLAIDDQEEIIDPFGKAAAALDSTARKGTTKEQGVVSGQLEVLGDRIENGRLAGVTVAEAPLPADKSRFVTSLKSEVPQDQQTRLRVLANDLFPDNPDGIKRVGFRNGKAVYLNDQGRLQYVSGPYSRGLAKVAGSSPEIAGSIVGSIFGFPVAGSAAGSMIGKAVKRGFSSLVFDEPVTATSLGKEVAIEGAVNAVAGKAGDIGIQALSRGRFIDPRSINRQTIRDAERLITRVKTETGIDLDLAQATGNRYLLELRDFVSKYPGRTSDVFQIRDAQAARQFDVVTDKVLDLVSQPVPAGIAGARAQNVAEGVITAARKDVQASVQPDYDAAYAALPRITDQRVLDYLKLPLFQKAFREGQEIAKLEGKALQPGQDPDLRSFDYLKQGLDTVIKQLRNKGNSKKAFAIEQRKNDLVAELDAGSGNLYKAARQKYQKGIQDNVDPLENGLVGLLARMSPQNAEKASKILKGGDVSKEAVVRLSSSLQRLDPDAFNGLVRQYLSREIDIAQRVTQGSEVINKPGKLTQALFGSPKAREKLEALLPAQALPLAKEVFLAAEKLAKTPLGANRIAGSQTQSKTELADKLGSRMGPIISLFTMSRQTARDAAEQKAREKGVDMIAEALTNPAKRKLLLRAVRISDETQKATIIGSILTAEAGDQYISDLGENTEPAK